MNNMEKTFFEEYIKLDNLCKDLLNSNRGVSSYIDEMEQTSGFDKRLVSSWDSDYKMLKHIRWVRNDIAHDNGQSECNENDIAFARKFYQRIMQQQDPFSMINKKKTSQSKERKNISSEHTNIEQNENNDIAKIMLILMGSIILIIIIIAIITWIIFT